MFENDRPVVSAVSDYLVHFAAEGFDQTAAGQIGSLLESLSDTPLADSFRMFGAQEFDRYAAILGVLVNYSRRAAECVAKQFGIQAGSITPEAVCELFYGVSDCFPITDRLAEYHYLDRMFDGTAPQYHACMTLKPFAAHFVTDGSIDDAAFMMDGDAASEYVEIDSQCRAVKELYAALRSDEIAVQRILFLRGEEGTGRRTAAAAALMKAGKSAVTLRCDLRYDKRQFRELASKLILLGSVPVAVQGRNTDDAQFLRFVDQLSEETGTVIAVCGSAMTEPATAAESVMIEVGMPTMEEQYHLWEQEIRQYPTEENVDLSELAGEFHLSAGMIRKSLRYAGMFADGETLSAADIKNGCIRSADPDMGSKAVRLECAFGWDDLVLPEHSKRLLRAACDQVRYRHKVYDTWGFSSKIAYGRSVSMLFTGPPGTGKTMGAQIVAKELGLAIYRISLANVVSKYIGETEKNLDEIFEKARRSKAVLFFDEADVLFSKRTEVKDANDKYSNMESAFLLQKIEEYSGVVILATNLVQNFDEAFKRRMKLLIDFPFPDSEQRREMWQKAFPDRLPLGNVDMDYLVEHFELSGSNIKNIALHAAFLAAAGKSDAVEMRHLIAALRNEYSKSGKAFTKAEAGEYFYYIDE